MIGIDGIAVINIVSNPSDAEISGKKKLQTRISHNDGATWKPLTAPDRDSLDEEYDCRSTVSCLSTDRGDQADYVVVLFAIAWIYGEEGPEGYV